MNRFDDATKPERESVSISIGNIHNATNVAVTGKGDVTIDTRTLQRVLIGGIPASKEQAQVTKSRLKKVMASVREADLSGEDLKAAQEAVDTLIDQLKGTKVKPKTLMGAIKRLAKMHRHIALALVPLMADPVVKQVFDHGGDLLMKFWEGFMRVYGSTVG